MVENPQHFSDMLHALADKGLSVQSDESLKRMPRGYEDHAGSELEVYFKYKGYTTSREFKDADFQDRSLITHVANMMEAVYPLLSYGWEVEQRTSK